jgi:hypothetical protein
VTLPRSACGGEAAVEETKALKDVFKQDEPMNYFAATPKHDHRELAKIKLRAGVPRDVQSYFNTLRNMVLYGRYVYAFHAVAGFLTYPVMEMALPPTSCRHVMFARRKECGPSPVKSHPTRLAAW